MERGVIGAPVNKQPRGLLDFLGIKSFGQYPQTMGNVYQPTVDLLDWLAGVDLTYYSLTSITSSPLISPGLAGPQRILWQVASPNALPLSGANITVPNNEYWLVMNYSVEWRLQPAANNFIDLVPSLTIPNVANDIVLDSEYRGNRTSQATAATAGECYIKRPVFMPPGSSPCLTVMTAIVSANSIFTGRIALHRILA